MRVTIGERLGLLKKETKVVRPEPIPDTSEPIRVEPVGQRVDLNVAPSSSIVPPERSRTGEDLGPSRVRGEMVWLKKDVSILRIEGRADLRPDEFADNRRR